MAAKDNAIKENAESNGEAAIGPRASSGEPLCIEQLAAEHHALLYRYAYRLSGSASDAEDLTQQTFLTAYKNLGQLREADRAVGWLCAILRSCFLKSRRRKRPISAGALELEVDQIPATADETPDWVDREQVQQAVDALPDEFKTVVLMFYFEQCSYREIAERLSLPIGTVMSRLSRGKSRLRGALMNEAKLS